MNAINSLITAFSAYSRIPMPQIEWSEKNSRYALCFFPLIGGVIGTLTVLTSYICGILEFGGIFRAALITALPLILTGGIHMDGYLDTTDALSSCAPKEKKLAILKDPNSGAFAVIYCCLWFMLYFASATQIKDSVIVLAAGFVLSRSLSALAVTTFRSARESGMGADMQKRGQKRAVITSSVGWMLVAAGFMAFISPVYAGAATASALLVFLYYRYKSYREFGGFTGDLAGWFLQLCELAICLSLAVTERIITIWF